MSNAANAALPGGPNAVLQQQGKTQYVSGLLVDEQNLLPDAESDRNAIGELFAGIIGAYNAQMQDEPVTINFTQGSMTFTVGGIPQRLFVQGRLVDYIPTYTQTAQPANSTQGRYDSLFVKYTQVQDNGRIQVVEGDNDDESDQQIYNNLESVTWSYTTGTPGQPAVTSLSGYELFALIYVPAGAAQPQLSAILFETAQARILADAVISINGLQGLINIIGGAGVSVGTDIHGNIILSSTVSSGVTSINSKTGVVTVTGGPAIGITATANGFEVDNTLVLAGGSGISVQKSSDGTTWTITNTGGSTSVNGATGAVVLESNSGTIGVNVSGENISLDLASTGTLEGIGATRYRAQRITGTGSISVQLPTLSTGNWIIKAQAVATVLGYNMNISLSNCTVESGGSNGIKNGPASNMSPEIAQIMGTATGGQAPQATLTFTASGNSGFDNGQLLEIWAYRDS